MSNATATQVPATAIASHDEWIAFYTAPQNISDFAREMIPSRILAEAEAGDYLAQEIVAADVAGIMRLEALGDEALRAEYADNEASHRLARELEGSEYDINDWESHYYQQGLIEALLQSRRVRRQYTGHGPLTHSPFAALAGAGL